LVRSPFAGAYIFGDYGKGTVWALRKKADPQGSVQGNSQVTSQGAGWERVRIGSIGGPGGSAASYRHSHLEFYHGNTGLPPLAARVQLRIDPANIFQRP